MNFTIPNSAFNIFASILGVVGAFVGFHLASYTIVDGIGLLNLISICLGLLALIVFSEAFVDLPLWKSFGLSILAPGLIWIMTLLPIGSAIGALIAFFLGSPSGDTVFQWSIGLFIYSVPILLLIDEHVSFPQRFKPRTEDFRWKMFGFYLGAGSLIIQLITSVSSLNFQK